MSTSKTEIGGSSTADEVERRLVYDIKVMFESSSEQFSYGGGGLGIISVPAHLHKLEEQAFTPLLISIGPIHFSNVQLQSMKKYKVLLCESFLKWINMDLKDIVRIIRNHENQIRSYYAEAILSSIGEDNFVIMILVDVMFIFGYFCIQVLGDSDIKLHSKIPDWMHPFLKLDMVLLENQLPFFILETLFTEVTSSDGFRRKIKSESSKLDKLESNLESDLESDLECQKKFRENFLLPSIEEVLSESNLEFHGKFQEKFLSASSEQVLLESEFLHHSKYNFFKRLAIEFFQCYNFQSMLPVEFLVGIENFTDLVRLFYLNPSKLAHSATQLDKALVNLPDRISGRAKLSYSATQLHEAGVKFYEVKQPYEGKRCFLDLRFDLKNGVLEIPCITLSAEKIRLIRNISALEQSVYVGHAYVTDFFVILDFLINTSKDVDLLCDKGILVNYLGDSNAAASAINSLNINILWDGMNSNYLTICEDLNVFYKKPWHRWRATFWRQYFSTPWRVASTSAAIILLLLTLAQTVCSLKSTIW